MRLIVGGVSTVRRYGFRPVRITASVGHRLREKRRRTTLREAYPAVVAQPRERATLSAPSVDLAPLDRLPIELREHAALILAEAEAVANHHVDYLGSGPADLGREIDWQRDFKSGYRWPSAFYQDVEVTRLDDDSDAKVPWELSRGHQLLTLARAARLSEDERFQHELEEQLESWLDANPAGYGINWVTPMEVAFRAINWAWAIGTVEGLRPLEPALRARVTSSLQVHGRHIAANLEGSPLLRSNHYLANVLGLLALAVFLADDPNASRWWRVSRRALEREIRRQVHDDGVGFEASIPYHGLSLEMFLLAWYISELAGRPLSSAYRSSLERMVAVSRSIRHPDGRSPLFGDQDSGRVLPAGFSRPPTQDHLLDLGAATLDLARQRDASPHEEVAWTLGVDRWRALAARGVESRARTTAFPSGGLYVLDGGGAHMVVRWGGVGQNGNGGHGHNDLSSYELSYGVPVVVDPGTYVYTADPAARDAFRSAAAHNVLVLDGRDMHPLPIQQPFRMPAHARFEVEEWRETADTISLVGSHDGFRTKDGLISCRRRISLRRADGVVDITDEVTGIGRHSLMSLVHLSPVCKVERVGTADVIVHHPCGALLVSFTGVAALSVQDGWVSSQYGVRERAPILRASLVSDLPATISYRIAPR